MAKSATPDLSELKSVARDLYGRMRSGAFQGIDAKQVAQRAYRDAALLLEFEDELATGTPLFPSKEDADLDRQLDDAFAPNLGSKHPVNLRSKRFGNRETLKLYKEIADEAAAGKPERFVSQCRENMAPDKANV